jgi:hypothetical protein
MSTNLFNSINISTIDQIQPKKMIFYKGSIGIITKVSKKNVFIKYVLSSVTVTNPIGFTDIPYDNISIYTLKGIDNTFKTAANLPITRFMNTDFYVFEIPSIKNPSGITISTVRESLSFERVTSIDFDDDIKDN